MRHALIALLLVASPAAAQVGPWGDDGGGLFLGGKLQAPLELVAAQTACSAALAVTWDTDPNTGFQRSNADQIDVCLAGVTAMRWAANSTGFYDGGGTERATLRTSTGNATWALGQNTNGMAWFGQTSSGNYAVHGASVSDIGAGTRVDCVGDGIASTGFGGFVAILCVRGEGLVENAKVQTMTCPSENGGSVAQETFALSSSYVQIVNNDPNGCEVTLTDGNLAPGVEAVFIVSTNAGGVVTIEDSANVVVASAAVDTTGVGLNGVFRCQNVDAADDYLVCNQAFAPP